jgi:CBS domain containing-hemolysin-like protein
LSEIATEILIVLLLIAANGVLALSEMAIVTARKARLQQRVDEGDQGAQSALSLAEKPTRFFSTTQRGIMSTPVLSPAVMIFKLTGRWNLSLHLKGVREVIRIANSSQSVARNPG